MSVVANVAINVDTANAIQGLNRAKAAAGGASSAFDQLNARAKAVQAIVEAQQGSFAKASTVQGVFSARVKNTEAAMLAQIAALREIQKTVQFGGALYQKAGAQIKEYQEKIKAANTSTEEVRPATQAASTGVKGLGTALQSALGPLLTVTTALATIKKGLDVAFERGAAEQRLKNITSSAGEFNAAMALAADTSQKFGLTQTEATKALGDVYSRLKGVGFGLQETGQIYQGFNVIAKQSGLAGEEAAGAFFQLSQALGKGKLNGDEFVIVAERMPQLLDAIAQTTGKSRGELTEMASQGQITSQVLYEALSGAADAAGDLNSKLTAQQRAMSNLSGVVDQLLNSIGQVFAPAVTTGAGALAIAGQKLADWWGYIGNVIFPKVYEALQPVITSLKAAFEDIDFDKIRIVLQNILIKGFEIAIGVISNFSKVLAFVIDRFKDLSQNPVFSFIAEQVGRLAGYLGLTNDKVQEFKDRQNEATQAAAETVSEYSSLPPKIEDAKEKAKQLKEEQKKVTDAIKEATAAADAQAKVLTMQLDQRNAVTQAYLKAEMQVNNVLIDQAKRQLDNAQNQAQRIQAAKQIYQLTVRQAELEYEATLATIQAERDKADIAVKAAEQKAKEVEIIVRLAAAQNTVNQEHYKALQAAREAVQLAVQQADTVGQVAHQQERAARAVYEGQIQSARAAYQQNIVAKETTRAADEAGRFAGNMSSAAKAAEQTLKAMSAIGSASAQKGQATDVYGGALQIENPILQKKAMEIWNRAQQQIADRVLTGVEMATGMTPEMERAKAEIAKLAAIEQEAANKKTMDRAQESLLEMAGMLPAWLARQLGVAGQQPSSGSRLAQSGSVGNATISPQVNINTGPVVDMGGDRYVRMQDLEQATTAAARQGASLAINQLQNNPNVRRAVGVAR